jgi:hygromycin-B 7''-O-kinase
MRNLLPDVSPDGDYVKLPMETLDVWITGVREIAAQCGVRVASISRFGRGETPVFEVNERVVIKLVPRRFAHLAMREATCLKWLSRCTTVPLPKLLGSGQFEDWSYLVSTKLPGHLLSEVWAELRAPDQEAVAAELGQLLAKIHNIPLAGFSPGNIRWEDFLAQGAAKWAGRSSVRRLPPRLRESGLDYIARAQRNRPVSEIVFLHGDLAPENCLVSDTGGSWRISGIFDFGNAMAGHALFDFTALTVLLAPGNAKILHKVFRGYGLPRNSAEDMQLLLMAYTLLHPLGDVSKLLGLIPGLGQAGAWDEVAGKFWPPAAFA